MKKFMLALSAVVCLQGASVNSNPAEAVSTQVAPNANPAEAVSTQVAPVQEGIKVSAVDVLAHIALKWAQSSKGLEFFGVEQEPTTWYGQVWKNFKSFDKAIAEPIGMAMRWMQYIQIAVKLWESVQPRHQQLTPEQFAMLQQRMAAAKQGGQQRRMVAH